MLPRIIKDRMVMGNEHERVRKNEAVFRSIFEGLKKDRRITCFREGSGSILA